MNYVVKKGDTIGAIASKYKTTITQIVSLNKLKNASMISVGQILIVPSPIVVANPRPLINVNIPNPVPAVKPKNPVLDIAVKKPNLKFTGLVKRSKPARWIVYHHSVSGEVNAATIHGWHLNKGWSGIGYAYVTHADGSVELGRPPEYIGAQVDNFNSFSVGMVFVGDFTKKQPTEIQLLHGAKVLVYLAKINGQTADSIIPHFKAAKLATPQGATACPGNAFPHDKLRKYILQEFKK